jgi:hypothetical protein
MSGTVFEVKKTLKKTNTLERKCTKKFHEKVSRRSFRFEATLDETYNEFNGFIIARRQN